MTQLVGGDADLEFDVSVWSNSEELNQANNQQSLTQVLRTEADLEMVGGFLESQGKFEQTYQVRE